MLAVPGLQLMAGWVEMGSDNGCACEQQSSLLWDEHQEHRSSTSSTPSLHACSLGHLPPARWCRLWPITSKQTIRGMSGMQGFVLWREFVFSVHHLARESWTILSGGTSIELRTPGEWKLVGGSGTVWPLFLHLGLRGAIVYLVVFAQALAFPSGPPVEVKLK